MFLQVVQQFEIRKADAADFQTTHVVERILNPGSKRRAWENKGSYFFCTEFSEHDVYRALDFLPSLKERAISPINRHADTLGVRDASRAFYDVTNCYF